MSTASFGAVWRSHGFGGKVKLITFILLPAVMVFACAEVLARTTITRRARVVTDSITNQRVYTMWIGRWPWSRRTVTPLNSLGFPDAEFPAAGPKNGCLHVVFSGDSYIFGDGVDLDSSFVEIVKRETRRRVGSRCVRMFNIGERGTTIDRQGTRIRETLAQLQPDIVILGQYQNDLTDLTGPGAILDTVARVDSARVHNWQRRLPLMGPQIGKLLSYHVFALMIQQGVERDLLRRWSVIADTTQRLRAAHLTSTYTRLYDSLVTELTGRGIRWGVVIIPSKLDVLAGRYPEEPYFVELAERNAVPYLRVFPTLDSNRTPYPFLMYDGHLNEAGNRLVASAVLHWLFEAQPAPFHALREP